jgi:competence protein ComEC
LSDRAAVAVALCVAFGAWSAADVPPAVAAGAVGLAVGLRRPWLLAVALALLASLLSHRAWVGLEDGPTGPVAGEVVLVSDPDDVRGSVRVDVRLDGRRLEAWARGAEAAALAPRLAGERVVLEGVARPVPDHARSWLARRHVGSRLTVRAVGPWRPGDPASRAANGLRRALVRGVASLDDDRRGLFSGFVLGDRRDQSVAVGDDFRGSGLTHLLAVSGQNVAFVLVLARPLLGRLGLRGRLVANLALIGFFALVTRWEPSVLRASAMASLAVASTTAGRPVTSLRLLALGATAILLLDPMLVGHLAFILSVAASAGIILLSRPIAARVPGPRVVGEALGVTLAAQIGVAPVIIPVFGGLPVASIPANLLAQPASGPVMMWGMSAGVVAGVVGEPLATWLHLPTSLLVGWIAAVARWGARAPPGLLGTGHLVALVGLGVATATVLRLRPGPRVLAGGVALAVAVALLPAVAPRSGEWAGAEVAHGARLWRDRAGATVLVIDDPEPGRVLDRLRVLGVRRLDVVVSARGSRPSAATVLTLRRRLPVRLVLAPDGHRVRDASGVTAGDVVRAGTLVVEVVEGGPPLRVEVRTAGGGRGGAGVASTG